MVLSTILIAIGTALTAIWSTVSTTAKTIAELIWHGLLQVFNWFQNSAPAPLRYMLFLFLMASIGVVLTFFLNVMGYECFEGDVYKTEFITGIKNMVATIGKGADAEIFTPERGQDVLDQSDVVMTVSCGVGGDPVLGLQGWNIFDPWIWAFGMLIAVVLWAGGIFK